MRARRVVYLVFRRERIVGAYTSIARAVRRLDEELRSSERTGAKVEWDARIHGEWSGRAGRDVVPDSLDHVASVIRNTLTPWRNRAVDRPPVQGITARCGPIVGRLTWKEIE